MGVGVGVGATPLLKQTDTSFSVGVTLLFVVLRYALYLRKRKPLNWLSDAPLMVKNVAVVPSGPTKLNGPLTLLLPAAWNLSVVFAGTLPVQDNVVHVAEKLAAGFASFRDEIRSPDDTNGPRTYVWNPPDLDGFGADQVEPLFVDTTRSPFA